MAWSRECASEWSSPVSPPGHFLGVPECRKSSRMSGCGRWLLGSKPLGKGCAGVREKPRASRWVEHQHGPGPGLRRHFQKSGSEAHGIKPATVATDGAPRPVALSPFTLSCRRFHQHLPGAFHLVKLKLSSLSPAPASPSSGPCSRHLASVGPTIRASPFQGTAVFSTNTENPVKNSALKGWCHRNGLSSPPLFHWGLETPPTLPATSNNPSGMGLP